MAKIFTSVLAPFPGQRAGWEVYAHRVAYGTDHIRGMVVIHIPAQVPDGHLIAEMTELMLMTGALPTEGIDPTQLSCAQYAGTQGQLVVVEYHSRPIDPIHDHEEAELANIPGAQ